MEIGQGGRGDGESISQVAETEERLAGAVEETSGLQSMPLELLYQISSLISVVDTASLSAVSKWTSDMSLSARFRHAPLLRSMVSALEHRAPASAVLNALEAISTLPVADRPRAMRLLCTSRMPSKDAASPERVAWKTLLVDTGGAIGQDPFLLQQSQLECDLEITAWHVNFPTLLEKLPRYEREFRAIMHELPVAHWADMLDAMASRTNLRTVALDIREMCRDATIVYPGVSDRLAMALLDTHHAGINDVRFRQLQRCFNITDEQRRRLVYPKLAIDLASQVESARHFTDLWRKQKVTDPILKEAAERIRLEEGFERLSTFGYFDLDAPGMDVSAVEADRWAAKVRAAYRCIEAYAYGSTASVADAQRTDQGEVVAHGDLFDAVLSHAQDRLGCRSEEAVFEAILQMPVGFQPVLMDRWANDARLSGNSDQAVAMVGRVETWHEAIVDAFVATNEHVNAVRATVALLRMYFAISQHGGVEVAVQSAVALRRVFEDFPIAASGSMLSYLAHAEAYGRSVVDEATLTGWVRAFLHDAQSSLGFAPRLLVKRLGAVAGPEFLALPDGGGTGTRFDRFCERFAIPLMHQAPLRDSLIIGMAQALPAAATGMRALVRAQLARAGFDDAEALQLSYQAIYLPIYLQRPFA